MKLGGTNFVQQSVNMLWQSQEQTQVGSKRKLNLPLVICLMHLHSSICKELGLNKALFIIVINFSIITQILAILAETKGQTTGNKYSLLLLTPVLVLTKLGKGPLNWMPD